MSKTHTVIIEGADGVGKTTLVRNLTKHYTDLGWIVIPISEPNQLIRGLRNIAKKAEVACPDKNKFISNAEINYEALYEMASPCSEASIALMIACMAQASDFLKKLSAQFAGTGKNILILKDRSLLSTFVYQALVPMKLHLVQDIWNAYSSLVQGDWASGCILLDADEATANTRHEKDCHYDANTKQILSCYRLIPAVFGMTREQYFNFVAQTNKPKELSNRLYEMINERSRLALMSRIPKYHTINTVECDQTETTQRAVKKINEWISQHQ